MSPQVPEQAPLAVPALFQLHHSKANPTPRKTTATAEPQQLQLIAARLAVLHLRLGISRILIRQPLATMVIRPVETTVIRVMVARRVGVRVQLMRSLMLKMKQETW